jgi:hypothetical protein
MWLTCMQISYRATDCIMAKIHRLHKVGNVCNAQQMSEALNGYGEY